MSEIRYKQIEEILTDKGHISVMELQQSFQISKATAYRYMHFLEKCGRARIVRGGISQVSHPSFIHYEQPYYEKIGVNTVEKNRIATEACKLIKPGMTIFLDSSTTVYAMCAKIAHMYDIRVITNDIRIAASLIDAPGVSIFVSGGNLRKNYYTLTSHISNCLLSSVTADIGFLSCDAITPEHGCMIVNADEIPIKKQIIDISMQRILLCDHTKFNRTAFMSFASIHEFDSIIVGNEISNELCFQFKKANYDLTII